MPFLGLMMPAFSQMNPSIKALVIIAGGTMLLLMAVRFVQKVGMVAIVVPALIVGAIMFLDKFKTALQL